ncbi:MAG TPA: 4Fe-4S dicluster domain-containing protein, partial [Bacteroidales bacterium]|nr:4Fe-4S dicluster domain-containing protein [Bacteroidales bacterium]
YSAKAHIDGNYELICPLVARDAGLGEIGRMGLLMTPKLGPRVRIAVVTTELPLIMDNQKDNSHIIDFCEICKKCADICPSASIPDGTRENIDGALRWKINHEKCFTYWCTVGTDCGKCMTVCPFSHPDNFLHNIIRWGIYNSYIFRRFALFMDDLFYGRKPKTKPISSWMQ